MGSVRHLKEWLMIVAMTTGGVCFAVGGTGFKFVRRFIMPFVLGLLCYIAGVELWRDIVFALSAAVVLSIGYGEKVSYDRKFFVFTLYGFTTLWLGFVWWIFLIGPLCFLLFVLSNSRFSSSTFVWKICEFLFGTLIGCAVANIIART